MTMKGWLGWLIGFSLGCGLASPTAFAQHTIVLRDLTLDEIGGILGLTGETVCRTFGLFKSRKIIKVRPRVIQVLNVGALQSAALL